MIETKIHVSIAICTFNREFFLEKCLNSIFKFSNQKKLYDIIVIDNNSSDNTGKIVSEFQKAHSNIRYFIEDNIGLSHARNRVIAETKAPYIAYIDDDVKISDTYITRLLWLIDNYEFDCLGGMYYPWYLDKKPKWISADFGKKEKLLDSIGVLESEYVTGLNMVFPKIILEEFGGFPLELGMIGNNIGYGEEDYVQYKIRENSGKIFFDPDLIVFHAVQRFKLSLCWQIKSIYINSKANFIIHKKNEGNLYLFFLLFKSIGAAILKRIPIGMFKLIFSNKFYYQNFILEVCKPILIIFGKIVVLNSLQK